MKNKRDTENTGVNKERGSFGLHTIFLVSENALKAVSYIDRNVSGELLTPAIKYVQDDVVERLLGTSLFHKLLRLVKSREIEKKEFGIYKELLDGFLFDLITYSVLAEIQVPLAYKTRNKGLIPTEGDKISNAFLEEVDYLVNHYQQRADFYQQRLAEWLECNSCAFPEWKAVKEGKGNKE